MSVRGRVTRVYPAVGDGVSYVTWRVPHHQVATVPIGYADDSCT